MLEIYNTEEKIHECQSNITIGPKSDDCSIYTQKYILEKHHISSCHIENRNKKKKQNEFLFVRILNYSFEEQRKCTS